MLCHYTSKEDVSLYVEATEVTFAGMAAYNFARLYHWRCGACGYTRNGMVDDAASGAAFRACSACSTRNRIRMVR